MHIYWMDRLCGCMLPVGTNVALSRCFSLSLCPMIVREMDLSFIIILFVYIASDLKCKWSRFSGAVPYNKCNCHHFALQRNSNQDVCLLLM